MSGKKKEGPKFSQFDEEFILKDLFPTLRRGVCADIGARSRRGSNVAFLFDRGWFCQLIDQDAHWLVVDFPIKGMKREGVHFRGESNHEIIMKVVTPENVNDLLRPDLNLLSIDIDGNDYYVWEAVKQSPSVVVIEIVLDMEDGIDPRLGCSAKKMTELATAKGYKLHAKTGVNLIFTHETFVPPPA